MPRADSTKSGRKEDKASQTSRAFLQRELRRLAAERVEGFVIDFDRCAESIFEWPVALFGAPETVYEGAYLTVSSNHPIPQRLSLLTAGGQIHAADLPPERPPDRRGVHLDSALGAAPGGPGDGAAAARVAQRERLGAVEPGAHGAEHSHVGHQHAQRAEPA